MKITNFSRRSGFTITEMLVATALTLFVMVIISTVFRAGTETFSKLRTAGMLAENLQHTVGIIKRDLASQHFDAPFSNRSGPYLSDQRLDLLDWQPPAKGYFEIDQTNFAQDDIAGIADADGLRSTWNVETKLRFTVKLGTQRWSEQFSAFIPPVSLGATTWSPAADPNLGPYCNGNYLFSPWAEVAYHLTPTGDLTEGGLRQLYTLRRKQRILSPTGDQMVLQLPNTPAVYGQLTSSTNSVANTSASDGQVHLSAWQNPPATVPPPPVILYGAANVKNPFTPLPTAAPPQVWQSTRIRYQPNPLDSSDVLMTNVISFEVKPLWKANSTGQLGPKSLYTASANPLAIANNSDYPFDNLPRLPDPSNPTSVPTPPLQNVLGNNLFYPAAVFDTWYTDLGSITDWSTAPAYPANATDTTAINALRQQPPLRINIRAIQIKIRIWDEKTQQTRQVTIVQEV